MILSKLDYGKDGLFRLYLDGEPVCKVDDETVYREKLRVGMEISRELFERLFDISAFVTVRKDCVRILNRKSCTRHELCQKLRQKGHSKEAIDRIIPILEENGLIDDWEYAENFIRDGIEYKKLGKYKIAYQLRMKGISDEIITQLMEEFPEEEDSLTLWLEKYLPGVEPEDRKELDKIRRRLYGKGFSIGSINSAINQYFAQHGEETDFEM